jgi:hypothetical protein
MVGSTSRWKHLEVAHVPGPDHLLAQVSAIEVDSLGDAGRDLAD